MTASNFEYTKTIIKNAMSRFAQEQNVVMFHVGRSGSTVLGSLFNQHKDIFWDSEIFMRNRMLPVARPATKIFFSFPKHLIQLRRMRTAKPVYGFEAKLTHVSQVGKTLPCFISELQDLNFDRFILLRRRNHLRIVISDLKAKQQGYWHQNGKKPNVDDKPNGVKIDVDSICMRSTLTRRPMSLVEHLDETEQDFENLRHLLKGLPVLELTYEEHIELDPTVAYGKVCNFLDRTSSEVSVNLRKTNPWATKDLISNYNEVATVLSGSSYEWMLESTN